MMHVAPRLRCPRVVAILAIVSAMGPLECSFGQFSGSSGVPHPVNARINPAISASSSYRPVPRIDPTSRGLLARLVKNPYKDDGSPPFALTDQAGTIQRFVEPVSGIDLDRYLDQVVIVRHDTGRTLLASQLELPPLAMMPLVGDNGAEIVPLLQTEEIAPAQFLDTDDATVQLLPEGQSEEPLADEASNEGATATASQPASSPDEALPELQSENSAAVMSGDDGFVVGSELGDPGAAGFYPGTWEDAEPCPECGGFHLSSECGPTFPGEMGPLSHSQQSQICQWFADVEVNFLRTHLNSNVAGKLSEKYEFSPRVILGFRNTGEMDGRVRLWHYGRDTNALGNGPIRIEFDVLDVEATHLFSGRRSEVLLSTGLRLAGIDISDNDGDTAGADLLGMTFAAEGRTCLCSFQGGLVSWVYGGRVSILGGDWGAEPGSDFLPGLTQDDNLVVHELITGIDYAIRHRGFDLHARLGFEMQNWHSDALSPDSIGLIGPGFQFGAEF